MYKKQIFKFKKIMSLCVLISMAAALSTQKVTAAAVAVERVTQAPLISHFSVHGTLYGKRDVKLTAGIDGLLTYVAEPGTQVEKGDTIAKIDTLPLEFEQAKQKEMLARAKINLRFHKQELDRLTKLAQSSSAAANLVDLEQNRHDLAQSDINLANIALRVIADKINRATLIAPFSGIISNRYMRSGKDINRADELIKLIDIENLEVRMYVPVKYLSQITLGESLPIISDNAGLSSNAKITAIIPDTASRSQSIEVRAILSQYESEQWAAGQLVDVSIPLTTKDTALFINRDALILRKQGVHVVKIDSNNTAHQIPVSVGKGQGALIAIKPLNQGSLSEGDTIAIRGAERLQTGQKVEVKNSTAGLMTAIK